MSGMDGIYERVESDVPHSNMGMIEAGERGYGGESD